MMLKTAIKWFLVLLPVTSFGFKSEEVNWFIEEYGYLAVLEMHEYQIPASITLAQALLESNCAKSNLASNHNNFFGIKSYGNWAGKSTYVTSAEFKNATKYYKKSSFRSYPNVADSWRDHSEFLARKERYAKLFSQGIFNYKGWAIELQRAGYATDPSYAKKLIRIIEKYHLHDFDKVGYQIIHNLPLAINSVSESNKTSLLIIEQIYQSTHRQETKELQHEAEPNEVAIVRKHIAFDQQEPATNKFITGVKKVMRPLKKRVKTSSIYHFGIR